MRTVRVTGPIRCNHSEATLRLAQDGLGIALLASWLVDKDIKDGRLVHLLRSYDTSDAPVRALTPPGRLLPKRVRVFIDYLRENLELS